MLLYSPFWAPQEIRAGDGADYAPIKFRVYGSRTPSDDGAEPLAYLVLYSSLHCVNLSTAEMNTHATSASTKARLQ